MLEVSLPAIWAYMYSWFTPTVFFVLLNIVIATIAISSSLASSPDDQRPAQDDYAHHPAAAAQNNLSRTSSVLHRLKSINLYRQKTDEIQPTTAFPDPDPSPAAPPVEEHHFGRSVSDSAAGEQQPKEEPKKMKKWASSKSAWMEPSRNEEEEITGVRRPATMRAGRVVYESVDARADDFINKFRDQLKLQRLDSFKRFKDMLNRAK